MTRLEDLDGGQRMQLYVVIERLVKASRIVRQEHAGPPPGYASVRQYLAELVRRNGLSDADCLVAADYLTRRHGR